MKTIYFVIIALSFFACSKNKKICREKKDPYIEAPSVVYERDTFQLKVHNVEGDNEYTADYWWLFPDMSFYPSETGPYGTSVSKKDAVWNINSASIRDEGTYTFTFNSEHCGDLRASKYIKVLPLPCPCFDELNDNFMLVRDSANGNQELLDCTINLIDSNGDLLLHFSGPMFTYSLRIDFDKTPVNTSTYYLRNYTENYTESQIPDNQLEEASISFEPSFSSPNEFRMIGFTEDIYVKVEGNKFTLSLCDVRFKSPAYGVKYVSAKIVFEI